MIVIEKINQIKDFEANLIELRRQPANSLCFMLPWSVDNLYK